MSDLTCARPYARAAFALASRSDSVSKWEAALDRLSLMVQQPTVQRLVHGPLLSDSQWLSLCLASAPGDDPMWRHFLQLLIRNKRLDVAPAVAKLFMRARQESEAAWPMCIESAVSLEKTDVSPLVAAVSQCLGRRLVPELRLNPTLIGGVVVRVGDWVMDASVQGKLAAIRQHIVGTMSSQELTV